MLLYRLIIIISSPFILGHVLWLTITSKQGRYFRQRLGFDYAGLPQHSLWFHCASVGEVNTLLPLLKYLHARDDGLSIIVTTNTITGGKIVQQQKLDYLFHCYLPFDFRFAVRRFLKTVKPLSLYVMETELWPNLFTLCQHNDIKIVIINARLSDRTTTANKWIRSLYRQSLAKVAAIHARSSKDADAYKQLGADEHIVSLTGNLKLTTILKTDAGATVTKPLTRDYILAASTHYDEEKKIYKVWKSLQRKELLVIAPRHPERSASIIKQLECRHIAVRSRQQAVTGQTEVYLLDTVGELKNYFPTARLVIMGGSFVAVGGHNILEPASAQRAVITGPFMDNFREELDLMLANDAIIQLFSWHQLQQELPRLLDDETRLRSIEANTEKLTHNAEAILEKYSRLVLSAME